MRKLFFWGLFFLLSRAAYGLPVEEKTPLGESPFRVVISRISDYGLFREIRQKIRQSATNVKMVPVSETPQLIEFEVTSTGKPADLVATLQSSLADRVTVELKNLPRVDHPSGIQEITISPK